MDFKRIELLADIRIKTGRVSQARKTCETQALSSNFLLPS